ncbi:MAG: hybrid sensor histidine kinase/response regulator [Planctomycetes bacterium]|nr:hybrid sensor histidine kinase/response regulator [Planctomycetota bacterium]MBI3845450.1 hybrid sensor histidine kinase/response regulator [Planctomycetota bacterium]
MDRPRILYVDDEAENLVVFRIAYRNQYDVRTCASAAEGLQLLEKETFPVVISDQRMPDMTGVEFLRRVRERWPDSRRIVLTAYTDVSAVIDAINLSHIYHFLRKPWERAEADVVLRNAFESYDLELRNRTLNEELLRKERLATLGQFVSGLTHELGNHLNVRGLTEAILHRYPNDAYLQERVEMIRNALLGMQDMVIEIRDFTRGIVCAPERRACDLGRLVSDALTLLRYDADVSQVKLVSHVSGSVIASCQSDKIRQVVINLVKNAAHATLGVPNAEVQVDVAPEPQSNAVRVAVTDNGCGIPTENVNRIFEPFFTTKGEKGTGMGLVICKRIVEAHGGTIACHSSPGSRTTFELRLPAAPVADVA